MSKVLDITFTRFTSLTLSARHLLERLALVSLPLNAGDQPTIIVSDIFISIILTIIVIMIAVFVAISVLVMAQCR